MNKRRAMWGTGTGFLVVVCIAIVVLITAYVDTTAKALSKIMTLNTAVPTHFSPQPTLFCNLLRQQGGLQKLVDSAGAITPQPNASLLTLLFMTAASPDTPTGTAMVGLYKEVLKGQSHSAASEKYIYTVGVVNPCTGYP
jgi:hypothetical protein